MPWVVGIDEAGYGPNLGPFVQAAVALPLPDNDLSGWKTLRATVRRVSEPDDGRLLVDDSKKVYAGGTGFELLAAGVFAALGSRPNEMSTLVNSVVAEWCSRDLADECWYDPTHELGAGNGHALNVRPKLSAAVVPAPAFNLVVDKTGTKGAVTADGVGQFLAHVHATLPGGEPIVASCDKLGGRNFYGPILADAFPDGWPVAEKESAAESRYRILNLDREITVSFKPRADGENVCVALASMLAKYLREVCMRQFNAFWAKHVPGIKPTAGYPGDAKRFYDEIRPAMEALGMEADAVWRKK
jgi:ribonuclease HII